MGIHIGDVDVRKTWPSELVIKTATIANGAALSDAIDLAKATADLGPGRLVRLFMPAAWTAAAVTFAGSDAIDGTYGPVNKTRWNSDDAGAETFDTEEFKITAAAGQVIDIDPAAFRGLRFIKVRSGTVGSPVNQGAERVVKLGVLIP